MSTSIQLGGNGRPTRPDPSRGPGAPGTATPAGALPGVIEAASLERDLRAVIRGEVRFDGGTRGMYATDASSYRQVPIGVVIPRDVEDVKEAVRLARDHGAPILARGGGTSLAGQCCNVALVLDFSKYMGEVLEVNADERWARVQPGTVLDDLRAVTRPLGLTFGPDPATHDRCTFGGMIGNDSCGVHSIQSRLFGHGPRTADQILELTVLTYDGEVLTFGAGTQPAGSTDAAIDAAIDAGGRRGQIYRDLRDLRDRYADRIREKFPDIPRRVSGYNLPALLPENGFDVAKSLVGTESTCVLFLEAKVRLIPDPPARVLLLLGYHDAYDAGDHVPAIMEQGPLGLEGFDVRLTNALRKKDLYVEHLRYLPDGGGWLLVEFGGDTVAEAEEKARAALEAVRSDASNGNGSPVVDARVYADPKIQKAVWLVRESALAATALVPGEPLTWEGWEDAAVAPEHIGKYLREFRQLMDRYGYDSALYGHFGDGCVHCRINFDYETREGIDRYLAFIDEAADLVLKYGGSLSGEHGDGQSRGALLPKMFGDELMEAFRDFKRVWDPDGMMNPGKLIDAYPPDANLYLGVDYDPARPDTHFRFPRDGYGFHNATIRCVGVGKCRRTSGGTMCPSYMVTKEEKHSTRGRARLLNEMLRGETITDGWKSEEVKEALDLCLACKGCKGDCPVEVDMATYKAEFLSHYYEGRLRPRAGYVLGLIYWWARLAQLAPNLINYVAQTPGLSRLIKKLGGIAPERELPQFAEQTFRDWFRRRDPSATCGRAADAERNAAGRTVTGDSAAAPAAPGGRRVILWPDTFNNFFHPDIARAGVEVLEGAGFEPVIPRAMLCCGRPLYDRGMLTLAKRQLRQIVDELRDEIRAGTPIVGVEPSCIAAFRDELVNLFPHDKDALRLSRQTYLLSEFLAEHAADADLGTLRGEKAIIHGHCHHRAVLDFDAGTALFDRLGIEYEVLDSGCCGMAGSFGFEEENLDVSQAVGERVLLPAVRAADPRTMVITDGFSCREMLEQNRLRRPLHSAEVVHMAMERAGTLPTPVRRERGVVPARARVRAGVIAAAGLGATWLLFRAGRALLRRRE